jgi:hypothetical protein
MLVHEVLEPNHCRIQFYSQQYIAVAGSMLSLCKNQYWESRLQAFSSPVQRDREEL